MIDATERDPAVSPLRNRGLAHEAPNLSERLLEMDALRGLAAVMVLLFHYTTRFDARYGHIEDPGWGVPWGWLGVSLFFMISGFVIFMTLDRTRHPLDFLLSRFSRLYPTYWVAIAGSVTIATFFNLPGEFPGPSTVVANALMFHGLFGVKDVDGVYWSLQVELLFYAIMLALWIMGWLKRPLLSLCAWFGLQLVYAAAKRFAGVELPYAVGQLLVLLYIPYFGIGMIVYLSRARREIPRWQLGAAFLAALGVIAVAGEALDAAIAAGFGYLIYVAAHGKLRALRLPVLVWFGAISYPLYLLNEIVGWSILLGLEEAGWGTNLAIAIAAVTAISVAAALHYTVEMPVMHTIRRGYRLWRERRTESHSNFNRWRWLGGVGTVVLAITVSGRAVQALAQDELSEGRHLQDLQVARTEPVLCEQPGQPTPKILLVLGQSNAGNHGAERGGARVRVFFEGRCYDSTDPLPGATGDGGSIWSHLAPQLEAELHRRVLVAPLAVGATGIAAWTEKGLVRQSFERLIDDLVAAQLLPDAILWQQGESDVELGTEVGEYEQRFRKLVDYMRARGLEAPVFVARSSYCHNHRNGYIHRLQTRLPDRIAGVHAGANTDALPASLRSDGCHFHGEGLARAARLWADVLRPRLADH